MCGGLWSGRSAGAAASAPCSTLAGPLQTTRPSALHRRKTVSGESPCTDIVVVCRPHRNGDAGGDAPTTSWCYRAPDSPHMHVAAADADSAMHAWSVEEPAACFLSVRHGTGQARRAILGAEAHRAAEVNALPADGDETGQALATAWNHFCAHLEGAGPSSKVSPASPGYSVRTCTPVSASLRSSNGLLHMLVCV